MVVKPVFLCLNARLGQAVFLKIAWCNAKAPGKRSAKVSGCIAYICRYFGYMQFAIGKQLVTGILHTYFGNKLTCCLVTDYFYYMFNGCNCALAGAGADTSPAGAKLIMILFYDLLSSVIVNSIGVVLTF